MPKRDNRGDDRSNGAMSDSVEVGWAFRLLRRCSFAVHVITGVLTLVMILGLAVGTHGDEIVLSGGWAIVFTAVYLVVWLACLRGSIGMWNDHRIGMALLMPIVYLLLACAVFSCIMIIFDRQT